MSKKNQQKPSNNYSLDKFLSKNTPKKQQSGLNEKQIEPQTIQSSPKKRKIQNFTSEEENSKSPIQQQQIKVKFTLRSILRQFSLKQILAKCPCLNNWVEKIQTISPGLKKHIFRVLTCYLHNCDHILWSDKYKPQRIQDLFFEKDLKNVKQWIQAYEYNRKHPNQTDNSVSLITLDQFYQKNSKRKSIIKNHWKCQALILKCRSGIGLKSFIQTTTQSMGYECMFCSSFINQQKYLKQINQSTKSQNVITKNRKKKKTNNSVSNQTDTNSIPQKSVKLQQSSNGNSIHVILDVTCIYPQKIKASFYSQLYKSIEISKVPFILTTKFDDFPQKHKNYDVIEMGEPNVDEMAKFFWLVYCLQKHFSFDPWLQIQQQEIWEIMNSIFSTQPEQLVGQQEIKQIIEMLRCNLYKIYNFLQFQKLQNKSQYVLNYLSLLTTTDILQHSLPIDIFDQVRKNLNIHSIIDLQQLQKKAFYDTVLDPQTIKESFLAYKFFPEIQTINSQFQNIVPIVIYQQAKNKILHKLKRLSKNVTNSTRANELYMQRLIYEKKRKRTVQTYEEQLRGYLKQSEVQYLLNYQNY